MIVNFYKYQGAGNDFIIVDNRENLLPRINTEQYKKICDRRFGIGADGLMLLQSHSEYDFEMVYYNADGKEGTMCGNGGRCIVAFAKKLSVIEKETTFLAVDGVHKADVIDVRTVNLEMINVDEIEINENNYFLNTGSPHYVEFVDNIENLDVYEKGKEIRYSKRFEAGNGTNVNFVEIQGEKLVIRTYERGVENETLACGTGVVASSLAASVHKFPGKNEFEIQARGGNLKVQFEKPNENTFRNIWLEGPATFVFKGEIEV